MTDSVNRMSRLVDHHRLDGAALLTVCKAILSPGADRYISWLGVSEEEARNMPAVARTLLAHSPEIVRVISGIATSGPVLDIADNLTANGDLDALDALLELASKYVTDHEDLLEQNLWTSRVMPKLLDLGPGIFSTTARKGIRVAGAAYEFRQTVIGEIIRASDWEAVAQGETDDRDLLAAIIARRFFVHFCERLHVILDNSEWAALLKWAAEVAGQPLRLPVERAQN